MFQRPSSHPFSFQILTAAACDNGNKHTPGLLLPTSVGSQDSTALHREGWTGCLPGTGQRHPTNSGWVGGVPTKSTARHRNERTNHDTAGLHYRCVSQGQAWSSVVPWESSASPTPLPSPSFASLTWLHATPFGSSEEFLLHGLARKPMKSNAHRLAVLSNSHCNQNSGHFAAAAYHLRGCKRRGFISPTPHLLSCTSFRIPHLPLDATKRLFGFAVAAGTSVPC